jgi:hypothetical protein
MLLPPVSDRRWRDVVTGTVQYDFDFLAIKIFLGRISINLMRDSSEASIAGCVEELRHLLAKNANLPSAQRDIAKIFGGAR